MLPPTSISLDCRGPLGNSASGFILLQKAKEYNFMYRNTKIDLEISTSYLKDQLPDMYL